MKNLNRNFLLGGAFRKEERTCWLRTFYFPREENISLATGCGVMKSFSRASYNALEGMQRSVGSKNMKARRSSEVFIRADIARLLPMIDLWEKEKMCVFLISLHFSGLSSSSPLTFSILEAKLSRLLLTIIYSSMNTSTV